VAEAVRRLAADESLRAKLRSGGRETARRHTEPLFNEQVERHLVEVAGG
jgi:hypothetical protein